MSLEQVFNKKKMDRIGVEIPNVCFADLNANELRELSHLIADHKVVLLRRQNLSPKSFQENMQELGELQMGNNWTYRKDHSAIMMVTNRKVDGEHEGWVGRGPLDWHSDGLILKNGEQALALYSDTAIGTTLCVDLERAYHELPKEILNDLSEAHIEFFRGDEGEWWKNIYESTPFEREQFKYRNELEHVWCGKPLISTHPVNKRKGLFFQPQVVKKIHGLKSFTSEFMIQFLKHWCTSEYFTYIHNWQKGDLLFLDQIQGIHRRLNFSGERELWRIAFWYST